MNKGRLEAFSDGVFSIVMTLLVFQIKLPDITPPITNAAIWKALGATAPMIGVFFLSFAVLSTIWINHHFLFHRFAKSVDRRLNLMNLAYLMFVAFVPFSAYFIGTYWAYQAAGIIFGLNLMIILTLARRMMNYMRAHRGELLSDTLPQRTINQALFRNSISLGSYAIGIIVSFLSVPASLFFYAFPILFNTIPGTLDLAERLLGINLD